MTQCHISSAGGRPGPAKFVAGEGADSPQVQFWLRGPSGFSEGPFDFDAEPVLSTIWEMKFKPEAGTPFFSMPPF
jgi:hypothetical protein